MVFADYSKPLPGYGTPHDFYWVIENPAPLAGMRYPDEKTPWKNMRKAGFHHVVCLRDDSPLYDPHPLSLLFCVELEDLSHKNPPKDRVREEGLIRRAAGLSVEKLQKGEGVAIHCGFGTGRTGTVIGCILKLLGCASEEILFHLDSLHRARGRGGWPESPWQAGFIRDF